MEKHISELIKNNVRVVLPDLGAFIVKQRKPLKIIFNEFLKYNDGLLIEYITKTEGKDKEQVSKEVGTFVSDLKGKLEKNETIRFEGFGTLSKDTTGNIAFDLESSDQPAKQEVKKPIPTTSPENKEATKKEEKPKEEKKPVETEKTITKPKPSSTIINQPPKEEKKPVEPKKPTTTYNSNKYVQHSNSKNEKKKVFLWVAAAILAILIVILTFYINNSSKKETETIYLEDTEAVKPTEEVVTPPIKEIEETEQVKPKIEEPAKTPEVKKTNTQTASRTGQYHIIAGSFKIPSNAENYEQSLINQGYQAKNIGLINGYHMVSAQSYPTISEAAEGLDEIRSNIAMGAWILKY